MPNLGDTLLLLDTHVWIWLMNGDVEMLSPASRNAIVRASQIGKLRVSAITVWEVGMLEAKGRIRLTKGCLDWVNEALSAPGMALLPLSPEVAIESSRLPGSFHGDPADRILAATSRIYNAILVTQDSKLLDYGKENYLSVMAAQ
jgi:PIN domain nuclease of toxin-antitoxin system